MSYRINTNVSAMNAYRNLAMTGTELSKSISRLSTGLRIVTGADDPSGLIASEHYRAQISSIEAALRNNQDAANYAKTADGALDEVSRLLREARALAIANGGSTASAAQKAANQTQLDHMLASIDRIASETQFGTKRLLDGSAGLSAAVNDADSVSRAFFTGTLGTGSDLVSMSASGAVGVEVTAVAERAVLTGTAAYATGDALVGAGTLTVNGRTFATSATTTRDELLQTLNGAQAQTGVAASVDGSGHIVLQSAAYGSKAEVHVTATAGLFNTAAGSVSDAGADAAATVTYNGESYAFAKGSGLELRDGNGNLVVLTAAGNAVGNLGDAVQVVAGAATFQTGANAGQTVSLSLGDFSSSALGLVGVDITGQDMAAALEAVDAAITTVTESRGRIGSFVRNTVESNIRALGVAKENLSATESAIREIDVAEEMTNYTKLQILQQSGMAVLAQANASPQSVLSLLQG